MALIDIEVSLTEEERAARDTHGARAVASRESGAKLTHIGGDRCLVERQHGARRAYDFPPEVVP